MGLTWPAASRGAQGGNHLLVGAARNQIDIARHHGPAGRYLDPRRLNGQSGLPDPPDAG